MPGSDVNPTAEETIEFGRTSGGGGAAGVLQEWPNPAIGMFDGVEMVPGVPKPDPILVATEVERSFGGLRAVAVERIEVQRGAITALIGPNGAGKTTFFNLLTNFDRPDAGSVVFDGETTTGVKSHTLAARGMVRTFQLTKVLAKMSVLDNMMLAAQDQTGEVMRRGLLSGWKRQEQRGRAEGVEDPRRVQHDPHEGRVRRCIVWRSAQVARDGARDDGQSHADHARRADGGRQPGADAVVARSRQAAAVRGHHRDVRRTRHGRRPGHLRLGRSSWPRDR